MFDSFLVCEYGCSTPGGVRGWAYSPAMGFKLVWSLVDHTQSLDHPYYILIPAHAIERKDCRLKVIYCYWIGFPVPPLDSLPDHKRWPVQATGSLVLGVSARAILIDSWKITLCQVFTWPRNDLLSSSLFQFYPPPALLHPNTHVPISTHSQSTHEIF